jgi:NAD(P)-dependent dehydrogenase (short-subunit alcohol dehydrogenase family)
MGPIGYSRGPGAVAVAVKRLGGIDIMVHVVGGASASAGGFAVLDDDKWHRALDLNLLPAVRLDRALLPKMLDQGFGVIIHITSIQRQLPVPEAPSPMLRQRRRSRTTVRTCPRVSPKGIRVVRVSPGWVEPEAAVRLVSRLAKTNGTDYEGAQKALMRRHPYRTAGEADRSGGPRNLPRLTARCIHHRHVIERGTVPTVQYAPRPTWPRASVNRRSIAQIAAIRVK